MNRTDSYTNAKIVDRMFHAVVNCNLNHVPQTVRRVIETEAWRAFLVGGVLVVRFERFSDFITTDGAKSGCGWKPELVEGLLQKSEDQEVLAMWHKAMSADDARDVVKQSQDTQRPAHRPKTEESRDTKNNDVTTYSRKGGNTAENAERRLRKDRPDLHARVLAGEMSWNAAMIEAGFRKKPVRKNLSPLDRIKKLIPKLSPDERAELVILLMEQPPRREMTRADA
jgi:hypothetical protein